MQVARDEDADGGILRRAERGQGDGERLARGLLGDPRGEIEAASQRLREHAVEEFRFALERVIFEQSDRLRIIAPIRRGAAGARKLCALGRREDRRALLGRGEDE